MNRKERVELVEWVEAELPVKIQAELLSLNRSSLYYNPVPPSEEEIAIKNKIDIDIYSLSLYGFKENNSHAKTGRNTNKPKSSTETYAGDVYTGYSSWA